MLASGLTIYGVPLSMPTIIYTEEGAKISAQLWEETMSELSFANTAAIVEGINK